MHKPSDCDFGMIGLGVMGRNFLLNIADNGYRVIGYDLDRQRVNALKEGHTGGEVSASADLEEFLAALKAPKRVMLLVPAGVAVDKVIESILTKLKPGDIIIDGGNSHYYDTNRRASYLADTGIHFLGMGVSGGEKGARSGPSLMPGGSREAYLVVKDMLEDVSAKVNGEACVSYLGKGAAGHYVKMVHNGIEYGIMQLIAEIYDVLRRLGGLNEDELAHTFTSWNEGPLRSFLVEITADIFHQADDQKEGEMLINNILDSAKQKGTGKWTSQSALDLGVAIPSIDNAVSMRYLSSLKDERTQADKLLKGPRPGIFLGDREQLVRQAHDALHFAMLLTYAQGFALLKKASEEMGFGLNMKEVARIWRGGCIIRAAMLDDFMKVFSSQTGIANLILNKDIAKLLDQVNEGARAVVGHCVQQGLAASTLSATLSYYDTYRSSRLPSNLIQAQRDYFGAHTYERLDKTGAFHTIWGVS